MLRICTWYYFRSALIFESGLIGYITGLVIAGFRYILSKLDVLRRQLYETLLEVSTNWTIVWVVAVVLIGLLFGWAGKARP